MNGALRELLLAIKRGRSRSTRRCGRPRRVPKIWRRRGAATTLPASPDVARADALLCRIGVEAARRALSREPGVFGAEAPPRPELIFGDEEQG